MGANRKPRGRAPREQDAGTPADCGLLGPCDADGRPRRGGMLQVPDLELQWAEQHARPRERRLGTGWEPGGIRDYVDELSAGGYVKTPTKAWTRTLLSPRGAVAWLEESRSGSMKSTSL